MPFVRFASLILAVILAAGATIALAVAGGWLGALGAALIPAVLIATLVFRPGAPRRMRRATAVRSQGSPT